MLFLLFDCEFLVLGWGYRDTVGCKEFTWGTAGIIYLSVRSLSIWFQFISVIGDDGLYIILTGLARPQLKVLRSLTDDEDSIISSISRESFVFDAELKDSTVAEIYLPSQELVVRSFRFCKDRVKNHNKIFIS